MPHWNASSQLRWEFRYNTLVAQLGLPDVPYSRGAEKILTRTEFAEAELKDMVAHGKGANPHAKSATTTSDKRQEKR